VESRTRKKLQENAKGLLRVVPLLVPLTIHPRMERQWDKTTGRKSCNKLISKKIINSGNAAVLDWIVHPIEWRRGRKYYKLIKWFRME
jgi:hypothetical protein